MFKTTEDNEPVLNMNSGLPHKTNFTQRSNLMYEERKCRHFFYERFTCQHVKKAKGIQKSDAYLDRGPQLSALARSGERNFLYWRIFKRK